MILKKLYAYFLVSMQFILIFLLALYSFPKNFGFLSTLIFISGLVLGFLAVFVMQKSKLRITPDVAKNASLVKSGPYKYIRHPMYLSVLLVCLSMLLTNVYYVTTFFYLLLVFVLLLKISFEEKLLKKAFLDYKEYEKSTKRLIPFLF